MSHLLLVVPGLCDRQTDILVMLTGFAGFVEMVWWWWLRTALEGV